MSFVFNAAKQNKLADNFRHLHHQPETLVIPNAWDAVSAKIFEIAGFGAIATTSSGISWSCGYQDVGHIPPELMTRVIGRLVNVVAIPVSSDIEDGYLEDEDRFVQFFSNLIEAGTVGVNLEDSHHHEMRDIKYQTARIQLARSVADDLGVNVFINARTDVMAEGKGGLGDRIKVAVERAHAFKKAGADGVFVPFVKDMDTVAKLKEGIQLPLNILYTETLDVEALKRLKVDRISVGSHAIIAALSLLKKIAFGLKNGNDWSLINVTDTSYPELNQYFG